MRTIVHILCFLLLSLLPNKLSFAQQQWKFHLAFEDATGAKDTMWLIWDTTATNSPGVVDSSLGEQGISFNYNKFNVWVYNNVGDSTKTVALPYAISGHGANVRALNYQYPIIVRWDTSLFHAPYLPWPPNYLNIARIDNDYYFLVNNDPPLQAYNMLKDNQADAPAFNWGSRDHFPMGIHISHDPGNGIEDLFDGRKIKSYPNPSSEEITVESDYRIEKIELLNPSMQLLQIMKVNSVSVKINLEGYPAGLYIIKIVNSKNQTYHEKIVKAN